MRSSVMGRVAMAAAVAVALGAPQSGLIAQQPEVGPKVGDVAPDFTLRSVTKYGALRDAVTLSAYRGHTVVLAFFFRARSKG